MLLVATRVASLLLVIVLGLSVSTLYLVSGLVDRIGSLISETKKILNWLRHLA